MFWLYKITNRVNGKVYVGYTKHSIDRRWREHLVSAFNRQSPYKIHAAIRKYGADQFTIEELASGPDRAHICEHLEPYYIDLYDSIKTGYNMSPGGRVGGVLQHTEASKKKMSENNFWRGKDRSGDLAPFKGHTHTDEVKRLLSEKMKGNSIRSGAILSDKVKDKIRQKAITRTNDPNWVNPQKGKIRSAEHSARISVAKLGKANPKLYKTYLVTFPDGTQQIVTGMKGFCQEHNLNPGNMSSVAKGKLPHHKQFKCVEVAP